MASVSRARIPSRTAAASASAGRSASAPVRVFGRAATIISSDAPSAAESADADPPPGVGSEELNAASSWRSGWSASGMRPVLLIDDAALLDHRADRGRRDADEIDRRSIDDHRVHLLPRLEAADRVVAVEAVGGVDRRSHQRLLEREVHPEAGER